MINNLNIKYTNKIENYWLNINNHYSMQNKNKFINYFFSFINNKLTYKIYDIQDVNEVMNRENINIMLCVENCNYWSHYEHYNKYGNFDNNMISIYLYNHFDKFIRTKKYIVIPIIYLQINYFNKFYNQIQPEINTPFEKKKFCLFVSRIDIEPAASFFKKMKLIDNCYHIKDKEFDCLRKKSCYHDTLLLNIFNQFKFICCFENSISNGYITEKIFNVFFARSIPIYYGPKDKFRYFNKECLLDVDDNMDSNFIKKITKLNNCKTLYNNFLKNKIISIDYDDEKYAQRSMNFIEKKKKKKKLLTKMINVFSVCLWGDKEIYNIGAIKNADLCKKYYPNFEYWIYIHKPTVPEKTIQELKKRKNVKIIFKEGNLDSCSPMSWRFETIDEPNVEIMLCRDVDTRILEREVIATKEWIESGKTFHIMRDHPYHSYEIFGGMFGTRKIKCIPLWKDIIYCEKQNGNRNYDINFLKSKIYPIIKDDCLIHDNFWRPEKHCQYFTTKYNKNYDFVGMYVYSDESSCEEHLKMVQDKVIELKKQGIVL